MRDLWHCDIEASGDGGFLFAHWSRNVCPCSCRRPHQEMGAAMSARRIPLLDRFTAKVDRSSGEDSCWEWMAAKNAQGYGKIGKGGDDGWVFAHRVAYEAAYGKVPEGQIVMHRCDNPGCCNPRHLATGTQSQNLSDMRAKGRHCAGERMRSALLDSEKFRSRPKRKQSKSLETGRFIREPA